MLLRRDCLGRIPAPCRDQHHSQCHGGVELMRTAANQSLDAGVVEVPRLLRGSSGQPGRLVCLFGSIQFKDDPVSVHYIVDVPQQGYRVLRETGIVNGPIQSITPLTPAAAWYERELQDQYGVELSGHPDPRPLVLHENWPQRGRPALNSARPVPWSEGEYPFLKVEGAGVCEVALGPVHA